MLNVDVWFDQAWRDPWVVLDGASGLFHAFLTARSNGGDPEQRGVIGHATSPDLESWVVGPALPGPRGFGYMEIPQVFPLEGRWHLLFSAPAWAQEARPGSHCTGTFHAISDRLTGTYREMAPLFCDGQESLYGGKVVAMDDGLFCLAFRYLDSAGDVVGELTDPIPVNVAADGVLTLVESYPDGRS
jgi:beta-fructofuranosidase